VSYAIKADGIGKVYRLGERSGARLLSEAFSSRGAKSTKSANSDFHALRDVTFEIEHGTAVGIIGRNGAGKTTLLKLISRITRPSTGELRIRGRVGSLLEVGTGFHPELTGRENIFMNGSMLGMRRSEIIGKFDEIVAFADVDQFIDTPVKRYSSGMYVRLAFAVAAHLEPEILVVDEVLAVGDAAFQRKCLGKMGEVAGGGKTVLFVSHSLPAVQQLTSSALLLDGGALVCSGSTETVIATYMQQMEARSSALLADAARWNRESPRQVELVEAQATSRTGIFRSHEAIEFAVRVAFNSEVAAFQFFIAVYDQNRSPVGATWSGPIQQANEGSSVELVVQLPDARLAPGRYTIALGTGFGYGQRIHTDFDGVLNVCDFEVAAPEGEDATLTYWAPVWGATRFPPLDVRYSS
jgi:lipopolysaccharide transport system ATP-binding protein